MKKPDLLLYEKEAWKSGFLRVAGVDEAGRGPLAGPVVAGAVIFEPDYVRKALKKELAGLTDSKVVSEKKRNAFFELLTGHAFIRFGVGVVEPEEIDRINILRATHVAMARAVSAVEAGFALVDGLPVKGLPCASKSIVKGDALSVSISAASIVAKVTRDRVMRELDMQYPGYGFAKHKGYGTKAHVAALRVLGPCPIHRKTFRPVAELDQMGFGF